MDPPCAFSPASCLFAASVLQTPPHNKLKAKQGANENKRRFEPGADMFVLWMRSRGMGKTKLSSNRRRN
jgi:hypothetical protein